MVATDTLNMNPSFTYRILQIVIGIFALHDISRYSEILRSIPVLVLGCCALEKCSLTQPTALMVFYLTIHCGSNIGTGNSVAGVDTKLFYIISVFSSFAAKK